MVKKNPDFRFNRMRKSRKTEFFEVHTERAVITHLNSVVRHIPHFFSYMRAFCKALLKSMKGIERERLKSVNGLFPACNLLKIKFLLLYSHKDKPRSGNQN